MNDNVTLLPSEAQIKDQARAVARDILSESTVFQSMSLDDQKSIYLSLVEDEMDKQRESLGLSKSMATDSGKDMGYKGYDPGFQGDTRSFKELVDSVDFPKFVADLLKAVFDANLKVMKQQTDTYIKLMKEAVGSEEARSIALALASVRRSNWACSFPAPSFHEDAARWGVLEGI